jgi:serine/threonine protein kinase
MSIGGRLIGEGAYGCVFSPSLHCKYKKDQPKAAKKDELLSKLTVVEDAKQEYSVGTRIRGIPIWKNYFSVGTSICIPSTQQTDKDIPNCGVLKKHSIDTMRILSLTNVGTPVHRFKFQVTSFDMMEFFTHIIGAGALLALFGVVHRDLHTGNVLVDKETVPRIIDFGLARIVGQTRADDLAHGHDVTFNQESPDSTLINAIVFGYKPNKVIQSIIAKKPIIKKIRSILGISYETMLEQLDQYAATSTSITTGDATLWFNTYWRTIDSWSVGCIIVDLLSFFHTFKEFTPMIIKYKSKLLPLLRRMCAVNPIQRVDCVQALYYLQPDHFIIRKYGKAWLDKVGSGNIVY